MKSISGKITLSLALFSIHFTAFAEDMDGRPGCLLGEILMYRAYQALGDEGKSVFGTLTSKQISGESFVKNVQSLDLDAQTQLYLVGRAVLPLSGESALTFRDAFSKNRKKIQARIVRISSMQMQSIFGILGVPKEKWEALEKTIRLVR